MRLSVALLTATLIPGALVACSNGYGVPPTASLSANDSARTRFKNGGLIPYGAPKASVVPVELRSSGILAKIHVAAGLGRARNATPGIYASESAYDCCKSNFISGYPANDRSNGPPVCRVGPLKSLNDIAVDRKGDLIVPGVGARTIDVFSGPGLCGPKLGSIADPYGYPVVAAAGRNVQSSKPRGERIVVGHQFGGVSVCTLSDGCTVNLTTPDIKYGFGVAIARNGDCWASGYESPFPGDQPYLVYFARCQGQGVLATGFQNSSAGGLDIDDNGNLISLSTRGGFLSELYVYAGCDPACTLVGGPFPLLGTGLSVHLDGRSKRLVAADNQYKQLDIYSYSTTGIKYEYSISDGLSPSDVVAGAAFSPGSKE